MKIVLRIFNFLYFHKFTLEIATFIKIKIHFFVKVSHRINMICKISLSEIYSTSRKTEILESSSMLSNITWTCNKGKLFEKSCPCSLLSDISALSNIIFY